MSLIVTVFTREGIVMAADSRITLNAQHAQGPQQVVQLAVGQSDSVNKLFLAPNQIGIATFGAADIQGVPIAGYVDAFIQERLGDTTDVEEVPDLLLTYFRALPGPPATHFHVVGYKEEGGRRIQHVWEINIVGNTTRRVNQPDQQGAQWGGEVDVLTRLISPMFTRDPQGNYQELPSHQILWQFFTLQDAIDFAAFGMRATIESMRFQARAKSIGGSVDILVLRPTSSEWIAKKQLRAPAGLGDS